LIFRQEGKLMRIPALVRIFLLLIAVAFPALLRAQFQQPTPEVLKMTADPKAPGAGQAQLVLTRTPVAQGN
jgi:hypothetical protein